MPSELGPNHQWGQAAKKVLVPSHPWAPSVPLVLSVLALDHQAVRMVQVKTTKPLALMAELLVGLSGLGHPVVPWAQGYQSVQTVPVVCHQMVPEMEPVAQV